MAKTENLNKEKLKIALDNLKKAIEIKPAAPTENIIKAVEKIEHVDEVSGEVKEVQIETTSEVPKVTETVNPETVTPEVPLTESEVIEKSNSSLFDMFEKATEEDNKPDNLSRLEHIADTITDDDLKEDDLNLDEESPAVAKEMADVKATAWVEFGEIGISLLCMWIADDWSLEAQAKKFIISAPKKKAIKISIMRIILAKKKKTNPTTAIIFLCVGACLPVLFIAILTRIQKKRAHAEQMEYIKAQRALIIERNEAAAKEYNEAVELNNGLLNETIETEVLKKESKPLVIVKKPSTGTEKRGRHKKTCASFRGKKCNCKG